MIGAVERWGAEHGAHWELLRGKYPQYAGQVLDGPVIVVTVESWTGWAYRPPGGARQVAQLSNQLSRHHLAIDLIADNIAYSHLSSCGLSSMVAHFMFRLQTRATP